MRATSKVSAKSNALRRQAFLQSLRPPRGAASIPDISARRRDWSGDISRGCLCGSQFCGAQRNTLCKSYVPRNVDFPGTNNCSPRVFLRNHRTSTIVRSFELVARPTLAPRHTRRMREIEDLIRQNLLSLECFSLTGLRLCLCRGQSRVRFLLGVGLLSFLEYTFVRPSCNLLCDS